MSYITFRKCKKRQPKMRERIHTMPYGPAEGSFNVHGYCYLVNDGHKAWNKLRHRMKQYGNV